MSAPTYSLLNPVPISTPMELIDEIANAGGYAVYQPFAPKPPYILIGPAKDPSEETPGKAWSEATWTTVKHVIGHVVAEGEIPTEYAFHLAGGLFVAYNDENTGDKRLLWSRDVDGTLVTDQLYLVDADVTELDVSGVGVTETAVPHGLPYTPSMLSIVLTSMGHMWETKPPDATNVYLASSPATTTTARLRLAGLGKRW